MEVTLVAVPAIIVGLVEVIKRVGLDEKWLPLLDLILGILLTWLVAPGELRLVVIQGIVLGLSAGGLYDLGKEPVKAVVKKMTE